MRRFDITMVHFGRNLRIRQRMRIQGAHVPNVTYDVYKAYAHR